MKCNGRVQRGLTTEGRQEGVGALLLNNLLEKLGCNGLDVGGIGEFRIGHDGCGVGIHQDDPNSLFTQHTTCLGARVIELACLTNHNGTGANDHDGGNICAFRHVRASFLRTDRISNPNRAAPQPLRGGTER